MPSPFSEPESNADKGLVQVKVTGSFPVEKGSALHNLLPDESYELPSSWPTLAETLATSSEELEPEGTNPGLWDIHGSPEDSPNTGAFGPFDPQAPETLLSNGSLNADDAPMPAIRIDVHLAPNEGGSSLGGVGRISGRRLKFTGTSMLKMLLGQPVLQRVHPRHRSSRSPRRLGSTDRAPEATSPRS